MKIRKDGRREYCCSDMSEFCGKAKVSTIFANQEVPMEVDLEQLGRMIFYYCPFCGDKIDVEKDE